MNITIDEKSSLRGYLALPGADRKPSGGAVVVLMEAFGITKHIKDMCERLAQEGYVALAPDLYDGQVIDYADREKIFGLIKSLSDETVLKQIELSLDFLARQNGVDGKRLGTVGFCMGGRLSFMAAAHLGDRLRATACFYGSGIAPPAGDRFGRTPPIGKAEGIRAALFLAYGSEDGGIPAKEHSAIVETLSGLKKRFQFSLYPGAGHGFMCPERSSFSAEQSPKAYADWIHFFRENL